MFEAISHPRGVVGFEAVDTVAFGWMMPGRFQHVPLAERDTAVAWVDEWA